MNEAEGVGLITQEIVQNSNKSDFTEVFSWGSDRFGQLGLGKQVST